MSSTALSPNSTGKLSPNLLHHPPIQSYRASKLTLFPLPSFSHSSKSLHRPQTSRPSRRRSKGTTTIPSLSPSKPSYHEFLQIPLTRNNISPAAYAKTKKPLETNACSLVTAIIHRKNARARWRGIGIACEGLGLVRRELSGRKERRCMN